MKHLLVIALLALGACGEAVPGRGAADAGPGAEQALYTCPMHPHYISGDSDGTCPICGMDLVPASGEAPVDATDTGAIAVAPEIVQTIGVRTVPARLAPLRQTLRAFGTVEADERSETVVASRLEGWIEELAVRAEGDAVDPGTMLYRIYSPDLVAAQKDFLNALDIGNAKRIEAVRQRLVSMGMQKTSITELERTGAVIERLPVLAESGGVVADLSVRDGDYVKPGDPVMTVQSYDEVWVIAEIPEHDLHLLAPGAEAQLDFPSAPAVESTGEVDYIYPTIDPATRSGRLRIVVGNPSGRLRPGAYADIRIETDAGTVLSVPTEAILRDSRGAHVVLALGEGRFLPRPVETGASAGGMTAISEGLEEGDAVVSSGQFLLGSEANLRAGFSSFTRPQADEETPLSEIPVDRATMDQIDHFADMALYFHEALTDGYAVEPGFIDPVLTMSEALAARLTGTRLEAVIENAGTALRQGQRTGEGDALAAALSDLMTALDPWLMQGAPRHYAEKGLVLFEDEAGRRWLQEEGPAQNPFGSGSSEPVPWPERVAAARPDDLHANH